MFKFNLIKNNKIENSVKTRRVDRGFTLIEMLVAVALFTVVMLIATATIFSIIGGNRKAQAINAVSNNLNFAIESMVRDIKTGYGYTCKGIHLVVAGEDDDASTDTFDTTLASLNPPYRLPDPATNPTYYNEATCLPASAYRAITLISTLNEGTPETVQYKFLRSSTANGVTTPGRIVKHTNSGVDIDVTSPEVDITDVKFFISNPAPGVGTIANAQPSVFILIKGVAQITDNLSSEFSLQTLVSQRILNI